jgi:hypothetical protein
MERLAIEVRFRDRRKFPGAGTGQTVGCRIEATSATRTIGPTRARFVARLTIEVALKIPSLIDLGGWGWVFGGWLGRRSSDAPGW